MHVVSAPRECAVKKIPDLLPETRRRQGSGGRTQPDIVIRTVDFSRGRCSHLVGSRLHRKRIRNDLIAHDLVLTLGRRARRRGWELDSLCYRLGKSRR
jgi:hypothetical protein